MGSSQNSIFKRVIHFDRKRKPKTEQQNTKQKLDVNNKDTFSDQEMTNINSMCINSIKDMTADFNNIQLTGKRLELLCMQLKKIVQSICVNDKFSQLRYDLMSHVQSELETDIEELESLYLEVFATTKNIYIIEKQHEAVIKDMKNLQTSLQELKEEEIYEMEMIISMYDKPMFSHWQEIKNSGSQTVLTNFLEEIQGKLQALKNLETLTTLKLKTLDENARNKNNVKTEDINNVDKSKENSVTDGSLKQNMYCAKSNLNNCEENLSTRKSNNDLQMETSETASVHFSTTSIVTDINLASELGIELQTILQTVFQPDAEESVHSSDETVN